MVKSRPSRDKSQRFDPLKAQQLESLKEDLPSSLRSADGTIRELACIAVANIPEFENPAEIARLVMERITDAEPTVQIAAMHAAINLSYQHSQELIRMGIIDMILPIVASHIGTDQLYSAKQEQLVYQNLVSNSLYLFSSLCSENDELLQTLKNSILIDQCIAGILSNTKIVTLPSIDLLTVFVEGDETFSQRILTAQSQNFFSMLPRLDSETKISLVSLVVTALEETGNLEGVFKYALPVVLEILNLDIHSEFLINVKDKLSEENFKSQEHFWTTEARAQQGALEILTNLLTTEDGSQPAVLQFLNMEHIKFVSKAANGIPKDTVMALYNYPELMNIMVNLQYASFSCIQNLLLNTSTLQSFIGEVWIMLIDHFERSLEFSEEETEFQEAFVELLTIVSKNLCAVCKKYPDSIVRFIQTEKKSVIPNLLLGIDRKIDEVTVNLLGVLSCVGKDDLDLETLEKIVACLVSSCASDSLEVNVEALNVFFDVFNDEKYDSVLQSAGVMPMMAAGVEVFHGKVLSCRDLEVKEHAQEALENLVEFIKYKALNIPS